ncbi:hypothetical protein XPU_4082 [Xanthomonas arboricola pv. pruni str. MAFF 311562]|uniref:Uncharacterized protein n=1 Tax=Xanthomonas arboricola pv. pruni str. MAFF 311562 TaxID=1414836 RepID=W4S7G3_9XANT|nr:hypothetical protein XPU_4082 [Xanthomonas arboricola pv. pruni str. MAFF 311562]GAE59233.1 hypothetical protein XPN_1139 [Xanthomonas arboricola pv. pruni MAFF 301427]
MEAPSVTGICAKAADDMAMPAASTRETEKVFMIATPFDEKEGKPAVLSDLSAGSFELLFPAVSPALLGAAPGPRCAGFG